MNRSIQLRSVFLLSIAGLLASVALAFAQADEQWKKRNDLGNRYEGRIGMPVNNPRLELLSFVEGSSNFPPGAPPDVTLKIRFFLPADAPPAFVAARELEEQKQYWMEAKQTSWKPRTWNEFSPWPTKEVLHKEAISLTNLGVTVQLGEATRNRFAPAIFSSDSALGAVISYTLYLRPGATLKRVDYLLSPSGIGAKPREKALFGEKLAGVPFALKVDVADLPEGPMRLKVVGIHKNKDGGPVTEYEFYHQPLK